MLSLPSSINQAKANLYVAARRKLLQVITPADVAKMAPDKLLEKFRGALFPLTPNEILDLVEADPMAWHWFTGVDIADTRLDTMRCKAVDALNNILNLSNDECNPKIAQLHLSAAKIILEQSKPQKPETQVNISMPKALKASSVRELEERKQKMLEEQDRRRNMVYSTDQGYADQRGEKECTNR